MAFQIDHDGDVLVERRDKGDPQQQGTLAPQQHSGDVLSDVHLEYRRPPAGSTPATMFTTLDGEVVAHIQHSLATTLSLVGLQVWRGALLLADYILHIGPSQLLGCTALELGAGPGLAGLVLARLADTVVLTDVGEAVLENLRLNARRHHVPSAVHVRQLDWLDPPDWLLPDATPGSSCPGTSSPQQNSGNTSCTFAWQAGDVSQIRQLDVLLAADCIYDDVLTEALMRCAVLLMRYAAQHSGRAPRLLVPLERRVVFTMTDMEARAPAYDYWRTLFTQIEPPVETAPGRQGLARQAAQYPYAQGRWTAATPFPLVGWRVDVGSIPQAIQQYQRSQELELWELALVTDAE